MVADQKKNYQQTIFLAIHKNEQQIFIVDKNNNSFLKTIYLYLQRSFLLNHRVLKKRNFSCDEKETLLVTASKHHSPAAGATQGYDCLLASVTAKCREKNRDNDKLKSKPL